MNQNSITTVAQTELTAERIDRGLEWLKHSLPSLNDCPDTRRKRNGRDDGFI
jgi:hypothetical protein